MMVDMPLNMIKLYDVEAPDLKVWDVWSTPSLPLHLCPLWAGAVVPVWVPSLDQIKPFENCSYSLGILETVTLFA